MVHFMKYEDSITEACNRKDRRTVIYGTGQYAKSYGHYIPNISYVCDTYAKEGTLFSGMRILCPQELESIKEDLNIIILTKRPKNIREIKALLADLEIEAYVFEFGNNIAFDCYHPELKKTCRREIKTVNLVCYEGTGWILGKFALRMQEQLEKRGIRAVISQRADEDADINHHIDFCMYEPVADNRDTLMITHILHRDAAEMAIHQLKTAHMGICMSKETMDRLVLLGAPREKLCYVNPAHDGVIRPKKFILGITNKTHDDCRKKEGALISLCKVLDPDYFAFKIMGSGWNDIVASIKSMGFQTDYYGEFDYDEYVKLIPSLDYYLYWGFDEGSMGYLDALAAGVETLVTPQGFHLDVKDGITCPCRTVKDFADILLQLQEQRKKKTESVREWTWEKYVDKHMKIWNYILGNVEEESFYENQHLYEDGENSVFRYRTVLE